MRLFTAQFTDLYFPVTDGVANVTDNYALWLNRSLGTCTVVAPWFPRSRNGKDGVRVLSYPSLALPGNRPYRFRLAVAPAFFRYLAALPLDLVHVQSPLMSIFPARWAAWRRRIPLVASFHTKYRDD